MSLQIIWLEVTQPMISDFVSLFLLGIWYLLIWLMDLRIRSMVKYGERNKTLTLDPERILFELGNYI